MSTINDFATTYMCQSLPFGGVKHSGFDRFGGACVHLPVCVHACMRMCAGRCGCSVPVCACAVCCACLHLPPSLA